MDSETRGEEWFALQVKTRRELSTATLLSGKGYETLLPTYQSQRRWSGRVKEVATPLTPGCVSCRFDVPKRLLAPGHSGSDSPCWKRLIPEPVEASEITAIQAMVSSGLPAEPWPYLEVGQKVRVEDDALRGIEGILIGFKGSRRIVVSVSLLRRSVALEIDRARVTPLHPTRDVVVDPLSSGSLLNGVIA